MASRGTAVVHFREQQYSYPKKKAVSSAQLFEDDEFPPNNTSLFCRRESSFQGIVWKRPKVANINVVLFITYYCYLTIYNC